MFEDYLENLDADTFNEMSECINSVIFSYGDPGAPHTVLQLLPEDCNQYS